MPDSPPAVPPPALAAGMSVWETFDAWLRRASVVIGDSSEALNAMNVFPISDADTGSNLTLTLAGITRAVPDVNRASADTVVQAAILSAHGNSGAIVAEMFSSVCRSLEHPTLGLVAGAPGERMALLLRTVADAARRAVTRPVAGTILTVAAEAARAAEQAALVTPDDALGVAEAAQAEARRALQRTPEQLDVLAAAGVVDAGGQAYALLVDALVEVLGGEPAQPLRSAAAAPSVGAGPTGLEYEVMYAVHGADPAGLAALRNELSVLGHSVVLVGGGEAGTAGVAQVHVHLAEPGAAVEAALGLGLGRLSGIRITALEPAAVGQRAVIFVVAGPGLAEVVRSAGAVAVLADPDRPVQEDLAHAVARAGGDVVILPNDMETLETAHHLVASLRAERRSGSRRHRMAVIPTVAQVQGLAALAVHDPGSDFDSAVTAMSAAAGHTRHGAVSVADRPRMTMVGRCRTGDVLGTVEDDVVEVGDSAAEVAWRVLERLLGGGGELLTLVPGAAAPAELVPDLVARARERYPDVDVQLLEGGQRPALLLAGLE